jgi:outer membrane protein OmpA-like peptidoglycan-associated protein
MRKLLFFIFLASCSLIANGQVTDTTIHAQGKITNLATKEPVVAKVSFQSLPYGNKVGSRSGSEYTFPLFDNDKYAITVEAAGFETFKTTVDPASANSSRKVVKDIELIVAVAKPVEPIHTVGKVIPLNNLIFGENSSKIGSASHTQLDGVAKMLHENPNMIIQIEGHTDMDKKETAKLNKKLSEERVEAVKTYLVSKGVSKNKVKTKAFGGTQPLYTGSDSKQRALNRRVEARILEN